MRDTLVIHGLEILRPKALLILLALPLIFVALRRSLVDLSRAQQWLSAGVRALLVMLIIFGLARPSTVSRRAIVTTVLLVDNSDSISDQQLASARRYVEDAQKSRHGDDQLRLVVFAEHPRVVELPAEGPLPPDLLKRDHSAGSDLEAALQLAYGLYPPGTLKRAVLISDGNETSGDIAAEAFAAKNRGVRVHTVSFTSQQPDEVLVRAVHVPSDVKIGGPFEVTAEVYASRAGDATLTLYRDEFVNPMDGKKTAHLSAGANTVKWKTEVLQPGFTTYKVVLSAEKDHFKGNNTASASLAVKGKPRVLYVEGEPSASNYLASALRRENIDVEVRSSYGLPRSPKDLQRFDLVLLSDVPAAFVSVDQMGAIEGYVRDLGGGFIMAGGENSFGSGGWTGSRLEKLLPVRFDVEKKRDQPALGLVLCIDRSGSMTGEKIELAKDAAKATAELLGPEDLIGVTAFDSAAIPIVRLQRAANRLRIAGDISRLQAGGGTNILPALREAYEELDPAPAKIKHVILLTDGQASYDGILELVDEMQQHKITVSGVGVGTGADRTLLTQIAERGGGRFYYTQDAQNIPKIFTKETTEVARSSLVEDAVAVQVQKHVELLEGVGLNEAPPLRGYVSTKPKPLTDLILVSGLGEPLLARWRVGLGQAVAWTSDVKNRWSVDWLRWPGYSRFWAHLIRSTMRHQPGTLGSSYEMSVDVDPPHARVSVDAVGSDDKFVSGLSTTLQVIDPDHPQKPFEVQLSESASGRYEGEFALDRYGSFLLRAVHKRDGVEVGESTGTVSLPYPREYLALPADEKLLQRVSSISGGEYAPKNLWDPMNEDVPFHRELWPFSLLFAALLLLVDVTLRRVRIFR